MAGAVATPGIDPQLHIMRRPQRWPQLDLAAKPGRRGAILFERWRRRRTARVDRSKLCCKIASLDKTERFDTPIAAMHNPHAGIGACCAGIDSFDAAHAAVIKGAPRHLDFGAVADRHHGADARPPAFIARRNVDRPALIVGDQRETIALIEAPARRNKALPQLRRHAARRLPRIARATGERQRVRRQIGGRAAGEVERPRDRPDTKGPGAAAAHDADAGQPRWVDRAPRNMAGKGIGDRHAIEQHQRPRRGVAAKRPQRHALRRRVGGAAVSSAKGGKARHILQRILDPATGGGGQALAIDGDGRIGRSPGRGGQCLAGDNNFDGRGQIGKHRHCLTAAGGFRQARWRKARRGIIAEPTTWRMKHGRCHRCHRAHADRPGL